MRGIQFTGFKIDLAVHYKSFLKALFWLIFTALCGTMPVLLLLLMNSLSPEAENIVKINEQLKDMLIPFLGSAMIAEICIEALLCKIRFSKYSYFFFFFSSALVLFLACIAYTVMTKSRPGTDFNDSIIWILHIFVVSYTVLFCLSIKTIMFIEEEKIHKQCRP